MYVSTHILGEVEPDHNGGTLGYLSPLRSREKTAHMRRGGRRSRSALLSKDSWSAVRRYDQLRPSGSEAYEHPAFPQVVDGATRRHVVEFVVAEDAVETGVAAYGRVVVVVPLR